jgi:hypothetical protein
LGALDPHGQYFFGLVPVFFQVQGTGEVKASLGFPVWAGESIGIMGRTVLKNLEGY